MATPLKSEPLYRRTIGWHVVGVRALWCGRELDQGWLATLMTLAATWCLFSSLSLNPSNQSGPSRAGWPLDFEIFLQGVSQQLDQLLWNGQRQAGVNLLIMFSFSYMFENSRFLTKLTSSKSIQIGPARCMDEEGRSYIRKKLMSHKIWWGRPPNQFKEKKRRWVRRNGTVAGPRNSSWVS